MTGKYHEGTVLELRECNDSENVEALIAFNGISLDADSEICRYAG